MNTFNRRQVIDIGGDTYYFGDLGTYDFELGFKTEFQFYRNFVPEGENQQTVKNLFIKYFPSGTNYKKIKYNEEDLEKIKTSIQYRIENLKSSINNNNVTLVKIPIHTNYTNLQKILQHLNSPSVLFEETDNTGNTNDQLVGEIDDDERRKILLGLMWYVINPDRIQPNPTLKNNIKKITKKLKLQTFPELPIKSSECFDNIISEIGVKTTSGGGSDTGINKDGYFEKILVHLATYKYNNETPIKSMNDIIQILHNLPIGKVENLEPYFEYISDNSNIGKKTSP